MEFSLDFNASYLVAFAMGLISSLHCIGMCGSIIGTLSLSLPAEIRENKAKLFSFVLNYNIGRITSYALAGALIGLLQTLLNLPFANGQGHRVLQLLSATVMTSAGLYIAGWFPRFAYIERIGSKFWKKIEPFGRKLIPVKNRFHAFLFGMVWGWLPCGLVYAALALAATSGNSLRSSLTMFAFGLGTLPAVIGIGIITTTLTRLSRMKNFRQMVGLFMITLALFSAMPWLNPMRLHHLLQL
jgi:sulfite exporter TauE/SafE